MAARSPCPAAECNSVASASEYAASREFAVVGRAVDDEPGRIMDTLIRRGIAGGTGETALSPPSTPPTALVDENRRVKRWNRDDFGRSDDGAWGVSKSPSCVEARPYAASSELDDPRDVLDSCDCLDPCDVLDTGRSRGSSVEDCDPRRRSGPLVAPPELEGRRSGVRICTGVFGRTADLLVSINLYSPFVAWKSPSPSSATTVPQSTNFWPICVAISIVSTPSMFCWNHAAAFSPVNTLRMYLWREGDCVIMGVCFKA